MSPLSISLSNSSAEIAFRKNVCFFFLLRLLRRLFEVCTYGVCVWCVYVCMCMCVCDVHRCVCAVCVCFMYVCVCFILDVFFSIYTRGFFWADGHCVSVLLLLSIFSKNILCHLNSDDTAFKKLIFCAY